MNSKSITWKNIKEQPREIGWFYVRNLDDSIGIRYWDDSNGGFWNSVSALYGFKPNHSFSEWAYIPEIHD